MRWVALVVVVAVVAACVATALATGVVDMDLQVRVDPDYIPPILQGKVDSTNEDPGPDDVLPEEREQDEQGVSSVGSISIGRKTLRVTSMTQPYRASDFPKLFSSDGQVVQVSGLIVGLADDRIEICDGGKWVPITKSVSEYGVIPSGENTIRVVNTGGNSWIRFLEQLP